MTECKHHFFPEVTAGGYSRVDGTVEFYTRINALLRSQMTVLDFGAGRGAGVGEDPVIYRRNLRTLKGKCHRVVGIDVDEALMENPGLDEAHVLSPSAHMPLETASVDLIVSDHTFEHIREPDLVAKELNRVLKPGGWLCARTPNRWGYIALGASLVPNRLHAKLLRWLQPQRKGIDVFPTAYKLNTRKALYRHFTLDKYEHYSYGYFAEPAYFGDSKALWNLALLSSRLMPPLLAPTWMVFLRKKSAS